MALDYGYTIRIQSNGTSDPVHTPTNQWQRKLSGQPGFTDLTGQTGSTYTVAPSDQSSEIRLKQVFNGSSAYSNALTVTSEPAVTPKPKTWTKVDDYPRWTGGSSITNPLTPDGAITFEVVNGTRFWVAASRSGVWYSTNEWATSVELSGAISPPFDVIYVYYNKYISKWVAVGPRQYATTVGTTPNAWNSPVSLPGISKDAENPTPSNDHKYLTFLVSMDMWALNFQTNSFTKVRTRTGSTGNFQSLHQMDDNSWVSSTRNGDIAYVYRNASPELNTSEGTKVFTSPLNAAIYGRTQLSGTFNGRRFFYGSGKDGFITCDGNGQNYSTQSVVGGQIATLWCGAHVLDTATGGQLALCSRYGSVFFADTWDGPVQLTSGLIGTDARTAGCTIGYDPVSNVIMTLTAGGLYKATAA